MPTWFWLGVLVAVSAAARAWLGRGMAAPFIMVDELVYAELARSFADSADFLVRGVPARGYSVVYPALISPAYLLFERLPEAYGAVKALNSVLMSLAAIPAYLLARRVVGPGLALLAAVLALALPSLVYTGTVMTENAFYPLFLGVVVLLVLVLERPSWPRQLALLAAIGVAYATRVQAVALLPAVLTAPPALALLRGSGLRVALRPYRWLYAAVVGAVSVVVVAQLLRGHALSDAFGAYSVVGESGYAVEDVARYFVYHVAELDLYLGIVPVVATILLAGRARSLDAPLQAVLVASLSVTFWLVLAVSAFASVFAQRIQERNTFVVAPLFLVLLLAWLDRGGQRPRALAWTGAAAAAALVLAIPFERFITTSAISDTLMLLPWWSVHDHVAIHWVGKLAFALAALLAAAFLLVPSRYLLALPLLVLAYYAVTFHPIWAGKHGFKQASAGALFQGIRSVPRDWVDAALPAGSNAIVVWTGRSDRLTINENEFFNRALGRIYYTSQPTPGGIGETGVRVDERDGTLRLADGSPLRPEYVLLDGSVTPDGVVVAKDEQLGTALWRVDGDLVSTTSVRGLYPNDTWSGDDVTWMRRRCRGGEVVVLLSSDPSLFTRPQTVIASIAGRAVAATRLTPEKATTLRVRLPEDADTCIVRFEISPTAVPAEVLPGSEDDRVLGAHFNAFSYEPAR